jgi:hypothetical protein
MDQPAFPCSRQVAELLTQQQASNHGLSQQMQSRIFEQKCAEWKQVIT